MTAFQYARPVWPERLDREMNLTCSFCLQFDYVTGAPAMKITASSLYRMYINGSFAGYGPARAAHGYYRVDEWDIFSWLKPGRNYLYIEVVGYNANTFYTLDQPSFLQAELSMDGKAIAWTDQTSAFGARLVSEREQKVQRYSYQRPFTEVWNLGNLYQRIRQGQAMNPTLVLNEQGKKALLPRGVPLPLFRLEKAYPAERGRVRIQNTSDNVYDDRSYTLGGTVLKGFAPRDLTTPLSRLAQSLTWISTPDADVAEKLQTVEYIRFSLARNTAGFLTFRIKCDQPTTLAVLFDEILSDSGVSFLRANECVNALLYRLEPGSYDIDTMECYAMQHVVFAVLDGCCKLSDVAVREYAAEVQEFIPCSLNDCVLSAVYEAGVRCFRFNAVDTLTSDPSRERAGWLQDSFWTARGAYALTGNCRVERNFLENYLLGVFEDVPAGMVTGCYPADPVGDRFFLPTNALWLILQLEEYVQRSHDTVVAEAFRPRLYALLDFYRPFLNRLGMLEDLPGWVFVEWSGAAQYTNGINYPVNMLYCGALEAVARLYCDDKLATDSAALRSTIRFWAHRGLFFSDNALWKNDELETTGNHSEICQYIAFYFKFASPETDPELFDTLCRDFGPDRNKRTVWQDVCDAAVLFGWPLRLDMLFRAGKFKQLLEDIKGYYAGMAAETGTLWEHNQPEGCLIQGANAHVCWFIKQCYKKLTGNYCDKSTFP